MYGGACGLIPVDGLTHLDLILIVTIRAINR